MEMALRPIHWRGPTIKGPMDGGRAFMRVGRHMPTHSKLLKTVELARQIGCEAIQIFASNPTGWRPTAYNAVEDGIFAQAAQASDIDPIVIHAPYLINLGSPDEGIWEKSITLLAWTLQRGAGLGVKYVVFHTCLNPRSFMAPGVKNDVFYAQPGSSLQRPGQQSN